MKVIFFLLIVFSLRSWGFGGVDVGNGGKHSLKAGILLPAFNNEEEVTRHVKQLLPSINEGTMEKIRLYARQGGCSLKDLQFKSVETLTLYQVEAASGRLEKKNSGYLWIEFKKCLNPQGVKMDIKPSGARSRE